MNGLQTRMKELSSLLHSTRDELEVLIIVCVCNDSHCNLLHMFYCKLSLCLKQFVVMLFILFHILGEANVS